MTKRKAESITDLSISLAQDSTGAWLAHGTGVRTVQGYGRGHKGMATALKDLVDRNWRIVVNQVIIEQGMRCKYCSGIKPLSGHHEEHRSQGRRKDIPSNIEALCAECHGIEHGQRRPTRRLSAD